MLSDMEEPLLNKEDLSSDVELSDAVRKGLQLD